MGSSHPVSLRFPLRDWRPPIFRGWGHHADRRPVTLPFTPRHIQTVVTHWKRSKVPIPPKRPIGDIQPVLSVRRHSNSPIQIQLNLIPTFTTIKLKVFTSELLKRLLISHRLLLPGIRRVILSRFSLSKSPSDLIWDEGTRLRSDDEERLDHLRWVLDNDKWTFICWTLFRVDLLCLWWNHARLICNFPNILDGFHHNQPCLR